MKRKLHVSLSTSDLPCLRADGCPWDELVCAEAAKGGHLEVLKWLRAEGAPVEHVCVPICGARRALCISPGVKVTLLDSNESLSRASLNP